MWVLDLLDAQRQPFSRGATWSRLSSDDFLQLFRKQGTACSRCHCPSCHLGENFSLLRSTHEALICWGEVRVYKIVLRSLARSFSMVKFSSDILPSHFQVTNPNSWILTKAAAQWQTHQQSYPKIPPSHILSCRQSNSKTEQLFICILCISHDCVIKQPKKCKSGIYKCIYQVFHSSNPVYMWRKWILHIVHEFGTYWHHSLKFRILSTTERNHLPRMPLEELMLKQ